MTREEQEELRHQMFINKINDAKTKEDLPNRINPSMILSTLAKAASFKGKKIDKEKLILFIEPLMKNTGYLISFEFRNNLYKVLKEEYNDKTDEEIKNKTFDVISDKRLYNLLVELDIYKKTIKELKYTEKEEEHKKTMTKINSTRMIEDLPKIGIRNINAKIKKDLYELFNKEHLKVEYTGIISKALLDGKDFNDDEIKEEVKRLCINKKMNTKFDNYSIEEKVSYIIRLLSNDHEIKNIIEEIHAKEKRVLKIYKLDHEDIMDEIKEANRISQMPPNLNLSRITGYLSGNSLIYPKGKIIPGGDFIEVAKLLLDNKKMSDNEIQNELKNIINKNYEENKEEAYNLLKYKLMSLPRLDYYVEEVKYGLQRQKEFISRGTSNVNVYFIPNPKSPIAGGRFYNCYLSSATNLNLEEILPIDLETIVPPNMDIDAVEWYVREHADSSFTKAGGIIVRKDESIGGVNVFRPNDGKIGITKEEKTRYEKLEELGKKLKEVTDKSKKAKEEFMKSQAVIDEQIMAIQDAMNTLIEEDAKVLKKECKEEK